MGLKGEPTVSDLLQMPGIWTAEKQAEGGDAPTLDSVVREKIDPALDALEKMRITEGESLVAQLRTCMERLDGFAVTVNGLRDAVRDGYFARLKTRLSELVAEAGIEPGRILAEAAMMAERSDVEEIGHGCARMCSTSWRC